MHIFSRDKASVQLNSRLTEGLDKDRSLGIREPGCLTRRLGSHFDSRKIILHISECQNSKLSIGSLQDVAEINEEMLRTCSLQPLE